MPTNPTVQMRALVNGHVIEGPISAKPGDPRNIFWTTEARARHYIENKMAKVIGNATAEPTGPKEQIVVGPSETKPMEASAKKSSPDSQLGNSTGSAKSDMSGEGAPSSAAQAVTASPKTKPGLLQRGRNVLRKRGR